METLAGEEGVENTAEGITEGIVVPLDSEGGKGWYSGVKNSLGFSPGTSII